MLDLNAVGRGNFSGDGVCLRKMSGGSLFVSSELLNMLLRLDLDAGGGGNFSGMEFVRGGCPGEVCSSVLSY